MIGGCVGTSNVLAGQMFDVPVMGTHAHSWIMSFRMNTLHSGLTQRCIRTTAHS